MEMEVQYIIAIAVGSVSVFLLFLYLIATVRADFREARISESIEKMYEDENLAKMEYDFIDYNLEAARILAMRERREGQMTIDDVLAGINSPNDPVYGKMDNDGPEEITGTYNPEL